jgi:uncharacterized protein YjbI with pentapeptide repeats
MPSSRALSSSPSWPLCVEPGCGGVRVRPYDCCLAHLSAADRTQALNALEPGTDVDFRGTPFSVELLGKLLSALRDPQTGRAHFGDADFYSARFDGAASFDDARFDGPASFGRATFDGPASFRGATFDGPASFDDATFDGPARLDDARFDGAASFVDADFYSASFDDATFTGPADFGGVTFSRHALFLRARLGDGSRLGPCRAPELFLYKTRIGANVTVQCHTAKINALGVECREGLSLQLDCDLYEGNLYRGTLYVDAPHTHSPSTLDLHYADGDLVLDGASFTSPTTIAAPDQTRTPPPRLLSLRRVDATNLTLVGLDLRSCRFLDCYNRDQLRIDGPPRFAGRPGGRWIRWRWTRRQILAEEHLWRARYDRCPAGWFPATCRHRGEKITDHTPWERTGEAARQQAARLQTAYRDLRKGREDAKDAPGAADLYYGEMEMRRFAAPLFSMDRVLLTVYWAVAGYGLRAWRAFATLLVVLVLGAVGFTIVGFAAATRTEYRPAAAARAGQPVVYRQVTVPAERPGWCAAFGHSLDSATSVLRPGQPAPLTLPERVLEIALRLLGPVLLGLVVLAIRGRVKR